MLYLIGYDVSTTSSEGKKRLNKLAKECSNYGQRVQNSLFECNLDSSKYLELRNKLLKIINEEEDSLRLYNLGKKYTTKVEHHGIKDTFNLEDTIIL